MCTELETLHLNGEDTEEVAAEILYRPYLASHAIERERIRKMSAICLPEMGVSGDSRSEEGRARSPRAAPPDDVGRRSTPVGRDACGFAHSELPNLTQIWAARR